MPFPHRGAPPPNSADSYPQWVGWLAVALAVLVALWLFKITPRKGAGKGRD